MAIYKIFAEQDTTIYSRYPTKNTGLDEILEISVKNSDNPKNDRPYLGATQLMGDDIRRSLIKFSDSDIEKIRGYSTSGSSYKTYFKAYIARAENLSQNYSLEFRPLDKGWQMGVGQFGDFPDNRTGASWYQTGSYRYNSTFPIKNWNLNTPNGYSYYFVSGGGSWVPDLLSTQSFNNQSSKDINVDITNISDYWFSGNTNNGIIVKHTQQVENNSGSFMMLNYFSNDTHTIYPPTLEIRWDDSDYVPGDLEIINNSNTVITLGNNLGSFNRNTEKYKFRINSRDKYPQRVFTTSSWYMTNKVLPQNSYWSLIDAKTNEVVVDYDYDYTRVNCDPTSSYFMMYMNGLEPERYYKIMVQSELEDGEVIVWDSELIFKVTK